MTLLRKKNTQKSLRVSNLPTTTISTKRFKITLKITQGTPILWTREELAELTTPGSLTYGTVIVLNIPEISILLTLTLSTKAYSRMTTKKAKRCTFQISNTNLTTYLGPLTVLSTSKNRIEFTPLLYTIINFSWQNTTSVNISKETSKALLRKIIH